MYSCWQCPITKNSWSHYPHHTIMICKVWLNEKKKKVALGMTIHVHNCQHKDMEKLYSLQMFLNCKLLNLHELNVSDRFKML